ncbi:MAG: ACT domain protein [Candidatus Methanoplasma sp.]|jgi:ACT domain-containing protein|nr:ACT domain protein [Candidatus Methanoplasma sp.]
MKNWEFTKIENNKIRMDKRLTDIMGLVDGGYIYSSLFKYPDKGPKRYELILSMYPQENFRALTHIDVYMEDVPGSTVQSAKFLGEQGINILNSVSLNGISETMIIWNIMCELNFAGEGEIIKERFSKLKSEGDPSVSLIKYISIKPANIGRIFRRESDGETKEEIRHGSPITFHSESFDLSAEYGDILNDVEGTEVMMIVDPSSWLVSVVFFKKDTKLVKINISIPDSPGTINIALGLLAKENINIVSVFSKVVIAYQTMSLEVVADMKNSGLTPDGLRNMLNEYLSKQNGIFKIEGISSLG